MLNYKIISYSRLFMKILVTDDSKIARKLVIKTIKTILPQEDQIFEASNGLEAYETYQNETPDLVFLDLTMPVMDGFEALEKIISHDKNAKIIVISADIQKGSMEKVSSLGALGFIKKPVNENSLREVLKRFNDEL